MENPVPESYEELFKRIAEGRYHHGINARTFEHQLQVKVAYDQMTAAEKQSKAMIRATWVLAVVGVIQLIVTALSTIGRCD
ncbi:hypothetical protein [Caldinitratiruptor microaerophilus]|uniref:Uncharacterized protein n=1 Tax=Caldinitratiruptor microaerophilus TaxID=671077 RepID=A0AA35GAB3_9FIRM|nr:hypothetical protein [Caldinitratiruptor microaerophilus]BDG62328.1 hypothetical protein caldi_34180 [Caldinitratiruptor microaerophilus]